MKYCWNIFLDWVSQTSIKFKSQLNLQCKLSLTWHLNLNKVCTTQSRSGSYLHFHVVFCAYTYSIFPDFQILSFTIWNMNCISGIWTVYLEYELYIWNMYEKFEDTKGVMKSHRLKDRQNNGKNKKKRKQRSTKHYTVN